MARYLQKSCALARFCFLLESVIILGGMEMARNVSPATSEAIDKEIKTIVENAHAKALAILNANRDLLESISEKLLETEVIEGDFLTGLLSQVKPAEVNV